MEECIAHSSLFSAFIYTQYQGTSALSLKSEWSVTETQIQGGKTVALARVTRLSQHISDADVGPRSDSDTGTGTGSDAALDAGPDADSGADPDADPDADPSADSDAVPGA